MRKKTLFKIKIVSFLLLSILTLQAGFTLTSTAVSGSTEVEFVDRYAVEAESLNSFYSSAITSQGTFVSNGPSGFELYPVSGGKITLDLATEAAQHGIHVSSSANFKVDKDDNIYVIGANMDGIETHVKFGINGNYIGILEDFGDSVSLSYDITIDEAGRSVVPISDYDSATDTETLRFSLYNSDLTLNKTKTAFLANPNGFSVIPSAIYNRVLVGNYVYFTSYLQNYTTGETRQEILKANLTTGEIVSLVNLKNLPGHEGEEAMPKSTKGSLSVNKNGDAVLAVDSQWTETQSSLVAVSPAGEVKVSVVSTYIYSGYESTAIRPFGDNMFVHVSVDTEGRSFRRIIDSNLNEIGNLGIESVPADLIELDEFFDSHLFNIYGDKIYVPSVVHGTERIQFFMNVFQVKKTPVDPITPPVDPEDIIGVPNTGF